MKKARRAYKKIQREYTEFKWRLFLKEDPEALWKECHKIYFYSSIKEYFQWNREIPDVYLDLVLVMDRPLRAIWKQYLSREELRFQTWGEMEGILEELLLKWRPKREMEERKEAQEPDGGKVKEAGWMWVA